MSQSYCDCHSDSATNALESCGHIVAPSFMSNCDMQHRHCLYLSHQGHHHIIIIIIRHAPSVRSSACCQQSPQRLINSQFDSILQVKVVQDRLLFRVAIQEV